MDAEGRRRADAAALQAIELMESGASTEAVVKCYAAAGLTGAIPTSTVDYHDRKALEVMVQQAGIDAAKHIEAAVSGRASSHSPVKRSQSRGRTQGAVAERSFSPGPAPAARLPLAANPRFSSYMMLRLRYHESGQLLSMLIDADAALVPAYSSYIYTSALLRKLATDAGGALNDGLDGTGSYGGLPRGDVTGALLSSLSPSSASLRLGRIDMQGQTAAAGRLRDAARHALTKATQALLDAGYRVAAYAGCPLPLRAVPTAAAWDESEEGMEATALALMQHTMGASLNNTQQQQEDDGGDGSASLSGRGSIGFDRSQAPRDPPPGTLTTETCYPPNSQGHPHLNSRETISLPALRKALGEVRKTVPVALQAVEVFRAAVFGLGDGRKIRHREGPTPASMRGARSNNSVVTFPLASGGDFMGMSSSRISLGLGMESGMEGDGEYSVAYAGSGVFSPAPVKQQEVYTPHRGRPRAAHARGTFSPSTSSVAMGSPNYHLSSSVAGPGLLQTDMLPSPTAARAPPSTPAGPAAVGHRSAAAAAPAVPMSARERGRAYADSFLSAAVSPQARQRSGKGPAAANSVNDAADAGSVAGIISSGASGISSPVIEQSLQQQAAMRGILAFARAAQAKEDGRGVDSMAAGAKSAAAAAISAAASSIGSAGPASASSAPSAPAAGGPSVEALLSAISKVGDALTQAQQQHQQREEEAQGHGGSSASVISHSSAATSTHVGLLASSLQSLTGALLRQLGMTGQEANAVAAAALGGPSPKAANKTAYAVPATPSSAPPSSAVATGVTLPALLALPLSACRP